MNNDLSRRINRSQLRKNIGNVILIFRFESKLIINSSRCSKSSFRCYIAKRSKQPSVRSPSPHHIEHEGPPFSPYTNRERLPVFKNRVLILIKQSKGGRR